MLLHPSQSVIGKAAGFRGRLALIAGLTIGLAGMALGQGTATSVSPNSVLSYSPDTVVNILGSNFASGSSVVFSPPGGPVTTLTPSQIQAAQIAATIPASLLTTAGTAQIAIQNSGGVLSNQIPFTITGPTATTVTPNSAIAHGRPVAITLAGTNIISTATVSFTPPGGRPTTVTASQVQAAQLAATIPAALLTTAGTAQIAIQNGPASLSNQLPFTISPSVSVKAQTLSGATVGVPYSDVVTATGGTAPYTWTLLAGVPPRGLSLAASGTVSGNPTAAGPGSFSVTAIDATGALASGSITITVKPTALAITSGAFPSGVVNFDYPQQILSSSGGSTPYAFAVTTGALPAGLTLTNGVIGGVPTTSGTSSFTITATDAAGTQTTLNTSIVIRPAGSDLVLLSGSVSFALSTGATGLPFPQTVGVQSANVAQTLSYTVATTAATWLSVSGGGTTPGSLLFSLTPAALSLPAGTSTATVTLTCTTTACAGKTQAVPVSLVVTSPPPQLSVLNDLWAPHSTSTPAQAQSFPFSIQNVGGGSLAITSITCETPSWCSIGAFPATLAPGPATQVVVTADPSKLTNGYYRTAVDVATSAGSVSVPVTFLISSTPYMSLSQSGIQFDMQATGAPGNAKGAFLVNAAGGAVNWTALVLPGSDWLTLDTASGTASDAQPGNVSYTINSKAASLGANTYYGTILVSSSGAINTPLAYEVVLKVFSATQPPTLSLSSGGLFYVANVGVAPPSQTLSVYTNSKTSQTFQAAASTDTGSWLSAPASGSTSAATPGQSAITVDPSSLTKPGLYPGRVTYALGGAGIRTANVLLILLPAGVPLPSTVTAPLAPEAAVPTPKATCSPTTLVLAHSGQPDNFSAPASWPTPLAMTLLNDCGKAVNNGQVIATFSNGDAPLALSLANPTAGLYTGTWTPRNPTGQLTINARATAAGFSPATAPLVGAVAPNAAPTLNPNGAVHAFNPLVGGALAPGTVVAIYGSNLASASTQPATTPLPTVVNGTTVLIGGRPAPLFYVSAGQINAQIPFELAPGSYQVLVKANGALTAPQPIQLSDAAPGLLAFPDGSLIAIHLNTGALVSQDAPAATGEYIIMFLLGMGTTDNPVTTGDTSPTTTLNQPLDAPTLTLGDIPAKVQFAGLTPGFVGLYQINLQVPDVPVDGNLVLTVTQSGVVSNTTILPVVH